MLSKTAIERLAEVDEYEVVKELQVCWYTSFSAGTKSSCQEYFADYAPLLPCLFSLNHTPTTTLPLYGSTPNSWDSKALTRSIEGITAVLLSLKKKPIIRYEKMSGMAKKLAVEVQVGFFD
jgi:Sec1 family